MKRYRAGVSHKEQAAQDNEDKIHVLDYDLYRAQERQRELEN